MNKKPNILLICTDQLRWDWIGTNGNNYVQTPQIDKLAAQGVNFQRAMSECPTCVPARRMLMTGLNTQGINMSENRDTQEFTQGPKLAETLTRSGYQTFAAGKLHTWPPRNRLGFEDVQLNEEGRRQGTLKMDDYDRYLTRRGLSHLTYTHGLGNNQYGTRISPLPTEATTTAWTGDQAVEFLDRRDPTRPFFLYVSFDKPHPPLTPPNEYWDLYEGVTFPNPAVGKWSQGAIPSRMQSLRNDFLRSTLANRPYEVQQTLRGFAALITHIDSTIGFILGHLREMGELENTWIGFISDHGDHMYDHGNYAKGDFFAGSCRVPYLLVPPQSLGLSQACGTVDTTHPVGLIDIMPTLLDAAGVDHDLKIDGQSLLPLIPGCGSKTNKPFRSMSFGHCTTCYGVSDGRYRYLWFGDDDMEYLFDQDKDPKDLNNLLDQEQNHPFRNEARSALMAWMEKGSDPHVQMKGNQKTLKPISFNWNLDKGESINIWNNRGRH